ncbi:MAG: acyl-CoA dehydrogenase [Deltaproteobacteria bacterium]|nr:MAG: acyl-CoA dehydrogenase [Deltaproteobacteria bacterium]
MSLSYELNAEQNILRQSVREFAEKEIKPVARELDAKEIFSYELTAKMAELGLFGIFVPPEYGGAGLDYVSYIIAVEELARIDGSQAATIAAGNSLGIGPIYYFGTEEQKMEWLPRLCTGEILAGFGLTEPTAGSDASGSKTHAVRDGDDWILNGSKIFITNAACDITGVIVVQAVTGKKSDGRKELSCFLVPADAKGLTKKAMKNKMMWRASNTAELYFDEIRLPSSALLGKQGDGFRQMMITLDGGRLSIGSMGLGGAQGAFELALAYSQERKQFNQSLFSFQATQFKLATMATEIEAARNMLYKACWLKDNKKPFGKLAAMAKLYCSEVMGRVADEAVQIHGGYGLMQEYDVERFYRDQKLLTIGEGTSEVQRIVIARHLSD